MADIDDAPQYLFLPMTSVWAIEPKAMSGMIQALGTVAGPVEDARRMGLPIKQLGATAVIPISGPLTKQRSLLSFMFGGTSMMEIRAALSAAMADDTIRQIVLLIDSPGGETDGLLALMDDVRAAAEVKTVIAQIDGMAASAAWFIASQATTIRIDRTDIVGSVGVQLMLLDTSKANEIAGIKAIAIDTGPFKSAGTPGTEITDEHIEHFQIIVDGIFAELSKAVMKSRGMRASEFAKIADGRLHLGADAVKLGLADSISSVGKTLAGFHEDNNRRRRRRASVARLELLSGL